MGRHAARRTRSSRWLLRVRAVLAGGLVLGLGATATLAAWNDSEYATTTVTSSRFGIEGNINATGFAEHATSPGPTLAYSAALTAVSPGTVAYTTVVVRTTASSTVGGTLQMQTSTGPLSTDVLAQNLQYAVRVVTAGTTCAQAVFDVATPPAGSIIVPNSTVLTTSVPANSQTLAAAAANPVTYCIRVSMPTAASSGAQGLSTTVTWQWLGTSTQ